VGKIAKKNGVLLIGHSKYFAHWV